MVAFASLGAQRLFFTDAPAGFLVGGTVALTAALLLLVRGVTVRPQPTDIPRVWLRRALASLWLGGFGVGVAGLLHQQLGIWLIGAAWCGFAISIVGGRLATETPRDRP